MTVTPFEEWSLTAEGLTRPGRPIKSLAGRQAIVPGSHEPLLSEVGPTSPIGDLEVINGDFTIPRNGYVMEGYDVRGAVYNNFTDVEIFNTRINGTMVRGSDRGCINANNGDNHKGAYYHDIELQAVDIATGAHNEWCSGLRGGNYTIERMYMHDVPDGLCLVSQIGRAKAYHSIITNGWYNEWTQATGATSQGGNNFYPFAGNFYTHTDGIQFHRGKDYEFIGMKIGGTHAPFGHHTGHLAEIQASTDMYNAAVLLKQEVGTLAIDKIERVLMRDFWVSGGASTLNITYGNNNDFTDCFLTNWYYTRVTNDSYILRSRNTTTLVPVANLTNHVFADDGSPVPQSRGN